MSDPFAGAAGVPRGGHAVATVSERLVVGVFNEHESEDTTAELLRSYGFAPAGRARRSHPKKDGMEYRIVWLDA